LAELAKVGERTITDFERHASNMLGGKRTAIRDAFEAADVRFDATNGIWFAESAIAENSGETASATGAENEGEEAKAGGSRIAAQIRQSGPSRFPSAQAMLAGSS
jgi:hypothetical protein